MNIFVFVVCGASEHINELQIAIKYLLKYSSSDIIVLTDTSRNATFIDHPYVIDIETPKKFDNHQASIFLKTSLHRYLPSGNNYCYLDTDVLAISSNCDEIFNQFIAPIRFAPDHCKVQAFSAYAVKCDCLETKQKEQQELNRLMDEADKSKDLPAYSLQLKEDLLKTLYRVRKNPFSNIRTIFSYLFSLRTFKLNEKYYLNRKDKKWYLSDNNRPFLYDVKKVIKGVEANSFFRWNMLRAAWLTQEGQEVYKISCDHLKEQIEETFSIPVKNKNWQHWNGGVFLFNEMSHDFLDAWHKKTMVIFENDNWRTRDQGTLIATAWEFDLSKHIPLDTKWNYIVDYYNPNLALNEATGEFSINNFKSSKRPAFLHIYHNFGLKGWPIWDWVEGKLS